MSVSGKTPIRDLLIKYPKAAEVFADKGMACLGCAASMFETVEEGAAAHGIDVDELVIDMNKALQE